MKKNNLNIFFCLLVTFIGILTGAAVLGQTEKNLPKSGVFEFPLHKTETTVNKKHRVVGGRETTPHAYPFQAALYVYYASGVSFCGGSLITNRFVLTAAHCVDQGPNYVKIYLGAHNLTADEPSRITLTSTTFIVHPDWSRTWLRNDVALIKLPQSVATSDNVATIEYVSGGDAYVGRLATVLGWGKTEANKMADVLKQVSAKIMNNTDCAATDLDYAEILLDSHLCTSGSGIVGSCSGDSGGPLVLQGKQVGIVSFGYNDCNSGKPSVYTRVTNFYEWILTNVIENDDVTSEISVTKDQEGNSHSSADLTSRFNLGVLSLVFVLQFYKVVKIVYC